MEEKIINNILRKLKKTPSPVRVKQHRGKIRIFLNLNEVNFIFRTYGLASTHANCKRCLKPN